MQGSAAEDAAAAGVSLRLRGAVHAVGRGSLRRLGGARSCSAAITKERLFVVVLWERRADKLP